MSDPLEEQEAILQAYVNGTLPEEQRQILEARMAEDPELSMDIALRKEMHQFIRKNQQRGQLQELLSKLESEGGSSTPSAELKIGAPPTAGQKRRLWIPALAVAATIALALFFWFTLQPLQVADFANPTPLALIEKGTNQSLETQIESSFNRGAYKETIPLLQKYLKEQPKDPLATLYLGISLFQTRQYSLTLNALNDLIETSSPFQSEAIYWTALAHWQLNAIEQSKLLLQKIPPSDSRYQQAQKLLKAL